MEVNALNSPTALRVSLEALEMKIRATTVAAMMRMNIPVVAGKIMAPAVMVMIATTEGIEHNEIERLRWIEFKDVL
jgi:hypothetical protein